MHLTTLQTCVVEYHKLWTIPYPTKRKTKKIFTWYFLFQRNLSMHLVIESVIPCASIIKTNCVQSFEI